MKKNDQIYNNYQSIIPLCTCFLMQSLSLPYDFFLMMLELGRVDSKELRNLILYAIPPV